MSLEKLGNKSSILGCELLMKDLKVFVVASGGKGGRRGAGCTH